MLDPLQLGKNQEQYERFYSRIINRYMVQYDYRDENGHLFSTLAPNLEEARTKRDKWLAKQQQKEITASLKRAHMNLKRILAEER